MPNCAVILLKSAADPPPDGYVEALAQYSSAVTCLPVLRIEPIREDDVYAACLRSDKYHGVIVSSSNGAAALARALEREPTTAMRPWRAGKPIFALGRKTASAVTSAVGPGANVLGEGLGNAVALAAAVVEYTPHPELPWLYLCGEQRLDTLPALLSAENIALEECFCYSSAPIPDIGAQVSCAVRASLSAHDTVWVVFFSPMGVRAVAPLLISDGLSALANVRLAAIGSTTAAALEAAGLAAHAISSSPTPAALAAALAAAQSD